MEEQKYTTYVVCTVVVDIAIQHSIRGTAATTGRSSPLLLCRITVSNRADRIVINSDNTTLWGSFWNLINALLSIIIVINCSTCIYLYTIVDFLCQRTSFDPGASNKRINSPCQVKSMDVSIHGANSMEI